MPDRQQTLGEMLAEARAIFSAAGIHDPGADARVLIAGLLDLSSTKLISNANDVLDEKDAQRIRDAMKRRCGGEPVHRILGFREFYGLKFNLSRETLEPRPDTEILVDEALLLARKSVAEKGHARVLDLGTGTGAICLAILHECPGVDGVGVDVSIDALETSRRNAEAFGLSRRFHTLESNWFSAVDGRFDLIVSNPPYIPSEGIEALERDVRLFDPRKALDGGEDGLAPYRIIANEAANHLEANGAVAVEIGWDQRPAVGAIFEQAGFDMLRARKDYGGKDRVMIFAPRGCFQGR